MLDMLGALLWLYSGKRNFFAFIEFYYEAGSDEHELILRAFEFIEREFDPIHRQTGEKYIRHLEGTALIAAHLLSRSGTRDAALIAAALLHDTIEDLPGWTKKRLAKQFGKDVANLVQWCTKPTTTRFYGNRVRRDESFAKQLSHAPRRAIIIKIADQLHNLITLWVKEPGRQQEKLLFARHVYARLAQNHEVLPLEFEAALLHAETRFMFASWSGMFSRNGST